MTFREHMSAAAYQYLSALLAKHGGNVSAVSREAKLNRQSLYRRLHALGLIAPTVRGNEEWRALQ